MGDRLNRIVGKCHCGNLRFDFDTHIRIEKLNIRACTCSFCQTHGAKYVSDPNGSVKISVKNSSNLNRYRFNHNTADFLICKVCGVYLAALITLDGAQYATLNLRTTSFGDRGAVLVSYDDETIQERIKRQQKNWTPVYAFIIQDAS
jgi:hypothetical protein